MATILLTRPQEDSRRFALQIREQMPKIEILVSPLMRVTYRDAVPTTAPKALIFTSRHGVLAAQSMNLAKNIPVFAVGDATARAAQTLFKTVHSADGDASALVRTIKTAAPKPPLLHIRGGHSRGEIAQTLNALGLQTDDLVAYDQDLLPLTPAAQSLLEGAKPMIVPLFSPRTAAQFATQCPPGACLFLACMSEAVADEVKHLPAKMRTIADDPTASAMLAALPALIASARRLEAQG